MWFLSLYIRGAEAQKVSRFYGNFRKYHRQGEKRADPKVGRSAIWRRMTFSCYEYFLSPSTLYRRSSARKVTIFFRIFTKILQDLKKSGCNGKNAPFCCVQ